MNDNEWECGECGKLFRVDDLSAGDDRSAGDDPMFCPYCGEVL